MGMTAKAKTIKMLLYDGDLSGVMKISNSAWHNGTMYSAPRDSIEKLIKRDDCKKYGVYLLLSDEQVYVGQARDLERRTKQHLADKDWWETVILMTTNDDSFNASDIDYLESRLIDMAVEAEIADSDNKRRGNPKKVDEFRQVELEQYLDEALLLLQLIGVRAFIKGRANKRSKKKPRMKASISHQTETMQVRERPLGDKPVLPDMEMKVGAFVKEAINNLLESGYIFTDEQMALYGSIEGSKAYTRRNLPMFWLLKEGETRADCDKNVRERYWREEFVSGKYRFLMFSQWYPPTAKNGARKDDFIAWYDAL